MSTTSTCSLEPLLQSLQFKSGSLSKIHASSDGANMSSPGHGTFLWSSGHKYVGEFVERKRHGYGVQIWPDGSKYEGQFSEDLRQGTGRHFWPNEETYEGDYVADKKHGPGTYKWPNGAYFAGKFKLDYKDGPCVYVSADGDKFEGVYRHDVREGEGVLTYPSGRQDVGVWKGTKLIQVRFAISEAFFDPSSVKHPLGSSNSSLGSPDLKHRGKFGPKGPLEVASEELIRAAACGDVAKVTAILKAGAAHVDVIDRNGHSALFAAAIHCHPEVINFLLDNGADVNKLDATGVSALNACHHLLYSSLPQVQAILKLLPPLKPHLSHPTYPPSICITNLTDCTLHTSDFLSTPHTHTTSPPPSICITNLTDCTLHTSDFLSTPHTHPSPHTHSSITLSPLSSIATCSECLGVCVHPLHKHRITKSSKANLLSSKEEGPMSNLQSRSYPLIPSAEQLKMVNYSSMNSLRGQGSVAVSELKARVQQNPLLNGTNRKSHLLNGTDRKNHPLLNGTDRNSLPLLNGTDRRNPPLLNGTAQKNELENESDKEILPPPRQLALMSLKDLPRQPSLGLGFSKSPMDSNSLLSTPPLYSSSASEYQDSPSSVDQREQVSGEDGSLFEELGSSLSQEGYSVSASANGDILGVSAVSPDFFSSSDVDIGERVNRDDEDDNVVSHVSLPSNFSCSSVECPTRDCSKYHSGGDEYQSENDSVSIEPPLDKGNREGDDVARKTSQVPFSHTHHSDVRETDNLLSFGPRRTTSLSLPPPPSSQGLHGSSVFSSTQYGPIVSAAQSTTLSYKGSAESNSTVSTSSAEDEQLLSPPTQHSLTADSAISLLLRRGADPNSSPLPLPPLVYAIRSGDVLAVEQLLKRGADVNQCLPPEIGGHTVLVEAVSLVGPNPVPIMQSLLKHGANPNLTRGDVSGPTTSDCVSSVNKPTSVTEASPRGHSSRCSPSLPRPRSQQSVRKEADSEMDDCCSVASELSTSSVQKWETGSQNENGTMIEKGLELLAGVNQGESCYTPLHVACAHRSTSDEQQELLTWVIPAMVELLLGGGANVNIVAMGHSPLSLAITNGHNKVVEMLLGSGADPNLPLGEGVGTALCSLTTHAALKTRDGAASITMVVKLLAHGANILQPVRVTEGEQTGTVVDFARKAFKEDKRLSCLKYSALSKSERARFRAWKKLVEHFVNLFRCRALQSIAIKKQPWGKLWSKQSDKSTTETTQPPKKDKAVRAMSALINEQQKTTSKSKKSRNIQSAGGTPNKSRKTGVPSIVLPEQSLMAALEEVTKHHGPTLTGNPDTNRDDGAATTIQRTEIAIRQDTKQKDQDAKMTSRDFRMNKMFEQALKLFPPEPSRPDSSRELNETDLTRESDKTDPLGETSSCQANFPENANQDNNREAPGHCGPTEEVGTVTISDSEWSLASFCYECGRSSGVHLVKCFGCQSVWYCSRTCKSESLKKSHKDECPGAQVKEMTLSKGLGRNSVDVSSLKSGKRLRHSLL